jgi:pentatricopeptide repeat protein
LSVLASIPKVASKLQAQEFIQEMKEMHQAGAPTRPNFVTYSTIMNAWAKQGHPERASEVLRLMYDDYLAGNETAKPDLQSFNTVLASYIKCKDRDAPARAEVFLKHMMQINKDCILDLHLDVYSWSSCTLFC